MTALSTKERVAKHRFRKQVEAFSSEYLDGNLIATTKEFIEAKTAEAQDEHFPALVTGFEHSLINPFYEGLKDLPETDDNCYKVEDMFLLWKECLDDATPS